MANTVKDKVRAKAATDAQTKTKSIEVHAAEGAWTLHGSKESKIVLIMLAMIAEIERDLISERTKEGLRARKAAGVVLGWQRGKGKVSSMRIKIALRNDGSTKTFITYKYKTSQANLHNR